MSSTGTTGGRRTGTVVLAVILAIIGVLAAVAGIIYLTKTSESLPSFLPGRRAHNTGHDTVRGIAALVIAGIALIGAGFAVSRSRSSSGAPS
jgi:hypothetical protein